MRAIIIEDKDARAILDKLKLESLKDLRFTNGVEVGKVLSQRDIDSMVSEIHRKFHYEVCSWLQDQGASVTK